MADHDRYDDWDRGREFGDRDRDFGRNNDRERGYQRPRGYQTDGGYQDRGPISRGADEVRSWFGDDEARRRRDRDEQRDQSYSERSGANSERAWRDHGWTGADRNQESNWSPGRGVTGNQSERGRDWSGSQYSPRGRDWDDPGYRSFQSQGSSSYRPGPRSQPRAGAGAQHLRRPRAARLSAL